MISVENWRVGTELDPLLIAPITRTTLALFAGASGDHQPTHLDIDAARAKGRDDVIVHGMLMMAYLGRLLTSAVPQDRIKSYKARFLAFTPPLAEPTCTGRVIALEGGLATLDLTVRLADGKVVVRGEAVIAIGS
jgi:acyl dehydratase